MSDIRNNCRLCHEKSDCKFLDSEFKESVRRRALVYHCRLFDKPLVGNSSHRCDFCPYYKAKKKKQKGRRDDRLQVFQPAPRSQNGKVRTA